MGKLHFIFFAATLLPFVAHARDFTDSGMRDRLQQQECLNCTRESLAQGLGQQREQWSINGVSIDAKAFGFHRPSESDVIPAAVARVAESTFKVVLFASEAGEGDWISRVRMRGLIAEKQAQAPKYKWLVQVLKINLAECEKANFDSCFLPKISSAQTGTVFLVGNSGRKLWSASHVFIDKIKEMLRASAFYGQRDLIALQRPMPIYLFDQEGRALATPFDNAARIVEAPNVLDGQVAPALDTIKIELQKAINRPGLQIARTQMKPGDTIYHLGFSNCTGCESKYLNFGDWNVRGTRYPFPESPGDELRVTIGAVFEVDSVLMSYSDGIYGMSGGPAVNARGEVVGVNVGLQLALLGTDARGDMEDPTDRVVHLFFAAFPPVDAPDEFANR